MSNIVLIGYRGSGKSSVGQIIADKTRRKLISTDDLIVERVGPIREFIEENSWNKFRDIETQVIDSIRAENAIIDCGGGVIERKENLQLLRDLGPIFWLTATEKTIASRIKDSNHRPSLTDNDFVSEISRVLKRRRPLYKKFADYNIKTDQKSPQELAQKIIRKTG